jgi:putative endonuclease
LFYLYILKSQKDGTFYIGQTNNIVDRLKRHNSGSLKSTKNRIPFKLVYYEIYEQRKDAMYREWEIKKKFNTERKRNLVLSFDKTKLKSLGL